MASAVNFVDKAFDIELQRLQKRAKERHEEKLKQIRDFAELHPDHPFAIANRDVVALKEQSSWNGAGVLSMTGLGWWALNLSVDLAYPNVVIFNATGGPDWSISLFTSAVAGYFFVDPSRLHGEYNFTLQSVAGIAGEAEIDIYKSDGGQIASFLGVVLGVSLSKLSGTGKLTYNP